MNKKLFIAAGVLMFVLLITVILILVLRKSSTEQTPPTTQEDYIVGVVSTESYVTHFNASDLSFYKDEEKVMTIGYEPLFITYSNDGTKAVLTSDVQNIAQPIEVIDFVTKSQTELDPYVVNATIGPDNKTLAYHYNNTTKGINAIYVSDYTGQVARSVYNIPGDPTVNYAIRWLDGSSLVIMPIEAEIISVPIVQINVATGSSKTLVTDKFIDIEPDPTGKFIAALTAFDSGNDNASTKFRLSIYDLNANQLYPTIVETSLIQAAWSKSNNKYYVIGTYGVYGLYSIDTTGKIIKLAFDVPTDWDITDMTINPNGTEAVVIANGQVKRIRLQ